MNTSSTLLPRRSLVLCLAFLFLAVLVSADAAGQAEPLPQAPAPRLKGEPKWPDVSSLVQAAGKRDWTGVDKAFRDLGPRASADLLLILLDVTKAPGADEQEFKGKLAPGDPPQRHRVKLSGGITYQIDMESKGFDTFLILYDSGNTKIEDSDDRVKGDTNSRIVHSPAKTDTYEIVAKESPEPLRPHTGDDYVIRVRAQGVAGPNAGKQVDTRTQLNTRFKEFVEAELFFTFRDRPITQEKKEELQRATQKYVASLLEIVDPPAPRPKDKKEGDAPEALYAALTGAAKDYGHKDWLQLANAFPDPLTVEGIAGLAERCLSKANTLSEKDGVVGETLQFLKTPTRQFGLTDPALGKRLRSVLLLNAMGERSRALSSLPPAREVAEWPNADALASGIKKSDVVPIYLSYWNSDKGALLSTPLGHVLNLLANDIEDRNTEVAERIAEVLLRSYRASVEKRTAIAVAVAKKPAVASRISSNAATRAQSDFKSAFYAIEDFLDTKLDSKPLDEGNNRHLQDAKKRFREAWIASLICHVLTRSQFDALQDQSQQVAVAERAARDWLSLCDVLSTSCAKLNRTPKPLESETTKIADQNILLPIAKREAFPVGNLLEVAPTPEMVLVLPPSLQSDLRVMRGKLLSLECRYNDVIEVCKDAVKNKAAWEAREIALNALDTWLVPAHDAGRSPAARTRMGDQTPTDFGHFVAALRAIPDLSLGEFDQTRIMETFAKFCASKRPLKEADLRAVLPELRDTPEPVIRHFVGEMLKLFRAERDAVTAAKKAEEAAVFGDAAKKSEAARASATAVSEAQETSEEYKALDAVLAAWRKEHATSWVGAMLHARVRFAWAHHQLEYVEKISLGAKTDVGGYSAHLKECMRLLQTAGELSPHSKRGIDEQYPSVELLRTWFEMMYIAAAERDTKETHAEDMVTQLRGWLSRLPEEESTAIRKALGQHLLRQLFAPDEGIGYTRVKDVEVYHFVNGAVTVLGDLGEATEFKNLQAGYRELQRSIRFCVVPDGTLYREGGWVGDQKRTFAVGKGEFGVWLTLQHTPEARERSGGFRRYAQNQIENPGTALDSRAAANYANDMKARLTQYLDKSFTIVHVEPLPQAETLRNRGIVNGMPVQETPLYYMVLKPTGSVPVTKIPPLPLDLNFSDAAGLVVLPFQSESVDLDPAAVDPAARQGISVKQRLLLNPRNVSDGLLTLEIASKGRMVPPPPEELFSRMYSPGFERDTARCSEVIKVVFQKGQPSAEVTRVSTISLRWHGVTGETEFEFPTGPVSDGVRIERLVWAPDSAMGESEGQPVAGETWRVRNLPRGPLPWSSIATGAAGIAVLALLVWCGRRVLRRPRRVKHAPTYAMPKSVTLLRTIRLLRQLAANPEIGFSTEDRAGIEEDIRKLEDEAMAASGNGKHQTDAAAVLQRWIEVANSAAAQPAAAK